MQCAEHDLRWKGVGAMQDEIKGIGTKLDNGNTRFANLERGQVIFLGLVVAMLTAALMGYGRAGAVEKDLSTHIVNTAGTQEVLKSIEQRLARIEARLP